MPCGRTDLELVEIEPEQDKLTILDNELLIRQIDSVYHTHNLLEADKPSDTHSEAVVVDNCNEWLTIDPAETPRTRGKSDGRELSHQATK